MSLHLVIKPVQVPGSTAEIPLDVDASATVEELKEQVAGRVGLPVSHIRLVCCGRIWQDTATVGSYEPAAGATVHCLNNPPRSAPPAAGQALTAVDPLQQMMGMGAAPPAVPAGGDPMQSMMSQAQAQMMQNPEMVQQIMSSPMVQQMMSDPETVRAMMRMNPQLNELMERRPEIARLLEDPEVLQQSMRMIANPSLMREMTRNADRAIGQLDAMPGGHSALVRAHEDFADPLFEAMSGGAGGSDSAGTNAAAYAQQTEGLPNSAALPNPWGAPAATPATPTPGPAAATPAAGLPGVPGANPMAAMMQQMMGAPAAGAAAPTAPAAGANPMAAMMQQMMSDPQQMQQMMGLSQQLMGGMGGGMGNLAAAPAATAPAATAPAATAPNATLPAAAAAPAAGALGAPAANPFLAAMLGMPPAQAAPQQAPAANPMASMMQQMMSNPAQMQSMMQLSQQLMGGGMGGGLGGMGAGMGTPAAGLPQQAAAPAAQDLMANPLAAQMQRSRFAAQLSQLTSMGFTNEAACLRALAQHGGRVDAAIDTLLSSGEGGS